MKCVFKIAKRNEDESFQYYSVSRQEVAFLEKARKIGGCGILKRDFYTRFIPEK